jgi:S-adenosylmethionine:tRNA-ribosyltransferase-isomerase (queuine synthetase)
MNEYCKYVVAIEKYLQEEKPSKKSWVDLFTETNVHIVGFGLAFEEIDLWYLLTRRMRRIKQGEPISNQIFFYQIAEKDKYDNAVTQMLTAVGVEVIPIEINNSKDKEDWKKAYQKIYAIIKGEV